MLRRMNAVATLRALRKLDAPTLTELAHEVGLSRPATEGALGDLAGRGLVVEVAPPAGKRLGRPARHYRFRAEAGYAVGVEITAEQVRLFLADLDGRIINRQSTQTPADSAPAYRLSQVETSLDRALAEARVTRSDLWAAAVGTPGVIDPDGRITSCVVIPQWEGTHLAQTLGRFLACPVLAENDANLAAVAEHWRGVAQEADDVVYVLTGQHTGIGVLIGGRLHRGRWGGAGEVGVLPEMGLRCTVEALIGPDNAERLIGPGAVLDAVRAGDTAARDRLEHLAARMARGVAAVSLALDPELVVVGGALTLPGDVLIEPLRRYVEPLLLNPTRLTGSSLGDEAVRLGAVRLALNRIEEGLYRVG
ncbi:Sugar kinase of the NBD/HSP70 family, may contain an N-terminal HTH domain [Micromonospora citrea]|uniref:Sugar kinase of the NBD/HSP70 family, may contain an N-terminal HTH domain n=2 Tax=Micromonospora citrea TaxID=47855 RepID=A0A1C6W2U8_9ACTN|nr:Sugar kinase of the NBD/HSP70 family, may contain an N-terminal HTH domain [Micromonospora citrea]